MHWLEKNWVLIVFVVAVFASFVVSNKESHDRDRRQASQLVLGCQRTSERSVLLAAYQQKTADVRRAAGTQKDIAAATQYEMFSRGSLNLVPLPSGLLKRYREVSNSEALHLAVYKTISQTGEPMYRVRASVREILHQGCVEAYT